MADIFQAVIIVSLDSKDYSINYCHPSECYNSDIVKQSPQFCFPEQQTFRTSILLLNYRETFSFTLTHSNGKKVFGYCRRYLDSGIATCICILTYLPSFGLYSGMLNVVEQFSSQKSHYILTSFLNILQKNNVPPPGDHLTINFSYPLPRTDNLIIKLFRPSGCNLLEDFVEFSNLFQCLDVKLVVLLWECLLREERVILCSKHLGKLTSSINAAISILNPLAWQHILIPVLPNSMLDYCTAPMPFFVGVLPAALPLILKLPTEQVYIFNLDEKTCSIKNTVSFIPKGLRSNLISSLETVLKNHNHMTTKGIKARDINIARCFIVCIAKLFEGYDNFIKDNKFQQDEFNNAIPAYKTCREQMSESQIWECFIETQIQLHNSNNSCILQKISQWNENELDFPCFKCNTTISNGEVSIYKGFPICKSCDKKKKNQITKDNVKQKLVSNIRKGTKINPLTPKRKRRASTELLTSPINLASIDVEEIKFVQEQKRKITPNLMPSPVPVVRKNKKTRKLTISVDSFSKKSFTRNRLQRSATITDSDLQTAPQVPFNPLEAVRNKLSQSGNLSNPELAKKNNQPNKVAQRNNNQIPRNSSPGNREVRCPGCKEVIRRNPHTVTLQAANRIWHPKCFVCFSCKEHFEPFYEDVFVQNFRVYHKKCKKDK